MPVSFKSSVCDDRRNRAGIPPSGSRVRSPFKQSRIPTHSSEPTRVLLRNRALIHFSDYCSESPKARSLSYLRPAKAPLPKYSATLAKPSVAPFNCVHNSIDQIGDEQALLLYTHTHTAPPPKAPEPTAHIDIPLGRTARADRSCR